MSNGPVFIGGLSFSGKTQLRLLLSSHPNFVFTRRTYMWTRFYDRYGDLSQAENLERCLDAMMRSKHIQALNPDLDRIRREFWHGLPTYPRLFALFHEHHAKSLGKTRWGDQLGFVEKYADPIFAAYPSAKMIHMIRNPIERCQESISTKAYRRGKVGFETAHWIRSAKLARQNQQRYPDHYKIVLCEELYSRPEKTLLEVCHFLDEEYFPSLLDESSKPGFWKEAGSTTDVDSEVDDHPTNMSKNGQLTLSKTERGFIHAIAGREMLAFGYPVEGYSFTAKDWLYYLFIDWPVNLAGMAIWRRRMDKSH